MDNPFRTLITTTTSSQLHLLYNSSSISLRDLRLTCKYVSLVQPRLKEIIENLEELETSELFTLSFTKRTGFHYIQERTIANAHFATIADYDLTHFKVETHPKDSLVRDSGSTELYFPCGVVAPQHRPRSPTYELEDLCARTGTKIIYCGYDIVRESDFKKVDHKGRYTMYGSAFRSGVKRTASAPPVRKVPILTRFLLVGFFEGDSDCLRLMQGMVDAYSKTTSYDGFDLPPQDDVLWVMAGMNPSLPVEIHYHTAQSWIALHWALLVKAYWMKKYVELCRLIEQRVLSDIRDKRSPSTLDEAELISVYEHEKVVFQDTKDQLFRAVAKCKFKQFVERVQRKFPLRHNGLVEDQACHC